MADKKKKKPEAEAAQNIARGFGQINTLRARIERFLGVKPEDKDATITPFPKKKKSLLLSGSNK